MSFIQDTDFVFENYTNGTKETDFDDIDEENFSELVVLDPNHALMKRFQNALETMLVEQLERLQLEDRETSEDLRKHRGEHAEAGNELFNVQKELAKFQAILGSMQDEYNAAKFSRDDVEVNLKSAKEEYSKVKSEMNFEITKMQDIRQEMDNIALRLHYLQMANEDIKGDIAVMKRAAEKAVEDLHNAENEKMHQDFLLNTLVSEVAKLKEDINMYKAQLVAQEDEKCASTLTLHEAQNEIQSILYERKNLMAKWNSSLFDLTRRNETFCYINDALS